VEWIPGHTPTAYFYDSEGKLLSETQIGNKKHQELLELFKQHHFQPKLKQNKYSSTPNSTATFGGHFYELYLTKNMYGFAELFALSQVHQNQSGYLLTITSKQENDFIRDTLLKPNHVDSLWLGAHDADTEGEWKWNQEAESPEANKIFYQKKREGISEDGATNPQEMNPKIEAFSNWREGEPNDADSDEDCAVITGNDGGWNDVRCGFVDAHLIVEYGSAELEPTEHESRYKSSFDHKAESSFEHKAHEEL